MARRSDNVLHLATHPAGAGAALRKRFNKGRDELVSNGPNAEFNFIGSDPYNTHAYTGFVVPPTPSSAIDGARYLFLLARASFRTGEQSPEHCGVRLVGIRQYVELVARLSAQTEPLEEQETGGPPTGSTVTLRKEIVSPLWHPQDGNVSWHVMINNIVTRDTRNPTNSDGFVYQDSLSPALLYQAGASSGVGYVPPNGGRPWGTPLAASLGNIHDLRYPWRSNQTEYELDIPIPTPCDVLLFASVRQNDPDLNSILADTETVTQQFAAAGPEDQFVFAYPTFAQYGTIAGSLVFDENLGPEVP